MKPILSLLCILFLCFSTTYAQNIEFHLDGRINKIENASHQDSNEFPSSRSTILTDSTQLISFGRSRNSYRSNYRPELGFEFGLGADIYLSDRFSIATGIGFAYSEMEVEFEFLDFQFDVFSMDTIPYTPPANNFIIGCDRTINTLADLRDLNERRVLTTLDLTIPVGFQYEILEGRLDLQIGGVMQTSIYADAPRERYELVRTYTNSGIECEYVIDEYQDDFLKRLSFMKVSLQGLIRYHLLKGVRIDVGVRKVLNNSFREPEFNNVRHDFRPMNYTFGFSYSLGKKKLSSASEI